MDPLLIRACTNQYFFNSNVVSYFFTDVNKYLKFYFYCYYVLLLQKAEAELAYELQAAKTKQRIKEENMQIKVQTFSHSLFKFDEF